MSLPTQVSKALQEDFEASQHSSRTDWIADVIALGLHHHTVKVVEDNGMTFEQVCAHLYNNG